MREALFLAYAVAAIVAARAVSRVPLLQVAAHPAVNPALVGFLFMVVLMGGGGAGFLVPQWIAEVVPPTGGGSPLHSFNDVGVLGRLAQVVGAVCGAWTALRGLWLWTVLGMVGLGAYAVLGALSWVGLGSR